MSDRFPPIITAELEWQNVDNIDIPISKKFGDVYFSKANGLRETRHVFLNGNDLSERLSQLDDQQYFSVGETGFGTGLNFLALWQLWQSVRPHNHSHLHFISVEKYPLTLNDLKRALSVWDELSPFANQLIEQYPLPLSGCHRLSFPQERISLDLWFGDAAQCFPLISTEKPVNAWFLDGFAPSCNPELWQTQIFQHIMRLSASGTTFASFSVAGVLKRALKEYGVKITRPKGFGHKREMLKAVWLPHDNEGIPQPPLAPMIQLPKQICIIGAGIAGLNCAWRLAQKGIPVTIFDQSSPLSGGSGNPLAMLNPKLCSIEQVATHLMTTSWQYALRFYDQFEAFRTIQTHQFIEKNIEEAQQLAQSYPDHILALNISENNHKTLLLKYAGAIDPYKFAQDVLTHPLITFVQKKIIHIQQREQNTSHLIDESNNVHIATHLIVCNALALNETFTDTPRLKPIRGQVSWAKLNISLPQKSLSTGYSYGGYAIPLDQDHLIFGASFLPDQRSTDIRTEDHQHNLELLKHSLPEIVQNLSPMEQWQGRASVRAQSNDYLPLVGRVSEDNQNIYCLAGLGSKGFLFAPLCSEVIMNQMLGEALPIPNTLAHMLRPSRFNKKTKTKKPYFHQN